MKEFRVKEEGLKKIRKQILIKIFPITLIAVIGGVTISELSGKNDSGNSSLPFTIAICGAIVIYAIAKTLSRQKKMYNSYILTIDENSITRKQTNTPEIKLLFPEIKRITKTSSSLVISGNNIYNTIIVPAQIEEIEVLENLLEDYCKIQISLSKPNIQLKLISISLAMIGLMSVTYLSQNKILVGICGVLLIIVMTISFINLQKNKNIDKRTRRSRYWIIVGLIGILGTVIYKVIV